MKRKANLSDKLINLLNINWLMCLFFVCIGMLICMITQCEGFWDFTNYHYYNPFAFFHNRMNYDIVPSSVNTFFNPLIDIPLYLMVTHFNDYPSLIFAGQGIWFGLLLFTFFKCATLFFDIKTHSGLLKTLLAVLIGATGQGVWFQAGSSTNEIQIAFLTCCSLYILLKSIKYPKIQNGFLFFIAGIILGGALGLKLTAIYICLSSGITLILCFRYLKHPLLYITIFAVAGLTGFLITNGWWMYRLWLLYQNPLFPFLNGFFHSPYFDDFNYSDKRFIPPFYIKLIYPFVWLSGEYRTAEINFSDIRGAVFYITGIGSILYLILKGKIKELYKNNALTFFYMVFILVSYLLWLNIFGIYRYLLLIEMISAIFFAHLVLNYHPQKTTAKIFYYTSLNILLYILIANAYLAPNNGWGRRYTEKQNKFVYIEPLNLPQNTLLKLYNFPTAGVIPILAQKADFRALGYMHLNATMMKGSDFVERGAFRKIRDKIVANHQGPVVVIGRTLMSAETAPLLKKAITPELKGKYCRCLDNSLDANLFICVPSELKDSILKGEGDEKQDCALDTVL